MVDLLLMERLFAALHPRALVVLLGDKDQLASVATGYVLGDMVEAAAEAEAPAALREAVSGLARCYRYREGSGLQELVAALRGEDPHRALTVLSDRRFPGVALRPRPARADEVAALLDPHLERCAGATDREEMERAFAAVRLLTPHRRGPLGVEELNRAVEARLRALGMATGEPFYRGWPVLIRANDYETGLFNGDTGISWPDAEGRMQVWFPAPGGGLRPVHPLRLPSHETGWALTVHKSQGSEYDRVILVLPRSDSPLATRELVYTGISRARREALLLGEAKELQNAVTRSTIRPSGLKEQLLAR
jgi:exodeoxyribonuclease V alpha subunit